MNFDEVFRNPDLRLKASEVREKFYLANADGHSLFKEMEALLKHQGEWDFEQEIKDHPHGVEVKGLGTPDFAESREDEMNWWLTTNIPNTDYIIMPVNAQGKYKDHWNWVYFRHRRDAILFKLSCL